MATADGCPPYGGCDNGWSQSGIYYLSWGAGPAYPYPEIYAQSGANAAQWASISSSIGYMGFQGALSQALACQQLGDPCTGMDNGPDQAWGQLSGATGQSPSYEADVGYE